MKFLPFVLALLVLCPVACAPPPAQDNIHIVVPVRPAPPRPIIVPVPVRPHHDECECCVQCKCGKHCRCTPTRRCSEQCECLARADDATPAK